jgi:xanthosine utilization system XapX-like protein
MGATRGAGTAFISLWAKTSKDSWEVYKSRRIEDTRMRKSRDSQHNVQKTKIMLHVWSSCMVKLGLLWSNVIIVHPPPPGISSIIGLVNILIILYYFTWVFLMIFPPPISRALNLSFTIQELHTCSIIFVF